MLKLNSLVGVRLLRLPGGVRPMILNMSKVLMRSVRFNVALLRFLCVQYGVCRNVDVRKKWRLLRLLRQ